jgi:hypothetical protein
MQPNSVTGNSSGRNLLSQYDIAFSLSQALGLDSPGNVSLTDALYQGLQPVVLGLREGDLTEEQASLLIELLLSAYIGAEVNRNIEDVFRAWAEGLTSAGWGEESGRI